MNLRNTAVIMGLALPPAAQEHGRSIQAIRTEIKQEENVQRVEKIEPDKISETQLAELGEAVMDVRFPNERQHTYMDEMMGGEGSRGFDRGGPIMSAALVFGSWSRCSRPPWWHCPWWWQPVVVAAAGDAARRSKVADSSASRSTPHPGVAPGEAAQSFFKLQQSNR